MAADRPVPPAPPPMFAPPLAAALLLVAPPVGDGAAPSVAPAEATLSEGEKLSYALGVNVARGLLRDGLDPDADLFLAGLRDTLTDRPLRLSEEDLAAALDAAAAKVREAAAARRAVEVAAASDALLAEFAAAEGVVTLAGGVLVKKPKTGDGPKPAADGRVRLHYTATAAGADAPFFTTRGGPAPVVPVSSTLPGLRAVLPTMPAGSRWTVALPATAAYGEAGGPGVPSNSALTVDVELLEALPPADGSEAREAAGEP